MGALYVIVGIVGILWIGGCGYMAYRNQGDPKKFRMWLLLAGVGIIPLVLSILRPGDKGDTQVIEVKPHTRTVAPTPEEQAKLDAEAALVKAKAEDLRKEGEKLDVKAEELDVERERLEAEVVKTDQELEAIKNPSSVNPDASRKPDPHITSRIKEPSR